ncbi:alpha/beta fold hydrolase [Streptomyces johnsoniae]|uniref:Alpha/beta hydrolase n=1 Tax=Streptomyces johnsoniae TaxID=3075532 RepID=A0ABU2S2T4_9ACTN|nr:alpha/beta hydrolase [Streptomyces sp. DSM 41886]MDT0443103.1 alpha/beta hydrolase [Streptomyces sp. DSM 41886]
MSGVDEAVPTEDGARLWATRAGAGTPVVCCHGGPGLWDALGDVAGLLADLATVHRWDQRGCGRSQRCGPYSVARSVADLDAVRRHFGLHRMALLGHSYGAGLALQYALAHPEHVSKLVYVSGNGIDSRDTWRSAYRRNLRANLGTHLARWETLGRRRRTEAEEREWCVLQFSADYSDRERALEQAEAAATPWFGVNHECNATINAEVDRTSGTPELRAACERLHVPVLIVHGAEDIRPDWALDSLEQALPRVSRTVLNGAGHLPWVEEPNGFRSAVGDFLAGLSA